eukprot:227334-Rhodomonas_salina.2
MESYGTDVYLHLSALGDGCENLPAKVSGTVSCAALVGFGFGVKCGVLLLCYALCGTDIAS